MGRNWKYALGVLTVVGIVGLTLEKGEASNAWLQSHIHANGSAQFTLVDGNQRLSVWTVSCRVRLRGCIARGQGLLLWVDDEGYANLNSATAPGARVSILWRNQSQDWPKLFSQPLTKDAISALSRKGAQLLIEEREQVAQISFTYGTEKVINYLKWLRSEDAMIARDARAWPSDAESLNAEGVSEEALERFRAVAARRSEQPPVLVPSTKPQAEFAIGAQNGHSFFVERGL